MSQEAYEVRETEGKGRGVYALRRFKPGDLVMEITGQVIPNDDYPGSLYCMDLSPTMTLEPHEPGGLVNHSCDGNCELRDYSPTSLALIAIVNIEPDRELTYDYGWPADVGAIRCKCGSVKCRKYIVAEGDEHRKLLRRIAAKKRTSKQGRTNASKRKRTSARR